MVNWFSLYVVLTGMLVVPGHIYAQEPEINVEQSAEVFLEQYTDEFQEYFFEALKQKGIENYDKAINLLLECKRLDAGSGVVDHELASVYLADKQYILAQEYSLQALNSDPSNYWYLHTLVQITQKQGYSSRTIHQQIPYHNDKLKENLALIYFRKRKYRIAQEVLKDLGNSAFKLELSNKIKDSLNFDGQEQKRKQEEPKVADLNPFENYTNQIDNLIQSTDFSKLTKVAAEALESFPSQPYFYFAFGLALNKTSKTREAIIALESALDYLVDDPGMADKIYKELASAHRALGNVSKANMYLSKIKSGS